MPRIWKPREHSLYRIASIALFRALLTQCRAAGSLTAEQRLAAANIVRHRFKASATETSVRATKHAYLAGYHALDLLDDCCAASPSPSTTQRIATLLDAADPALKAAPPPRMSRAERRRQRHLREGHDPRALACRPEGQKELDMRPRARSEFGAGAVRRHVPRFAVVNKLPFLRFAKPQPRNLERVLRQKLKTKQKRVDWSHVLLGFHVPLAAMEDRWDGLVGMGMGRASDEPRWEDAARKELGEVFDRMTRETERTWETAKRMQEIVDRERELAEQEAKQQDTA